MERKKVNEEYLGEREIIIKIYRERGCYTARIHNQKVISKPLPILPEKPNLLTIEERLEVEQDFAYRLFEIMPRGKHFVYVLMSRGETRVQLHELKNLKSIIEEESKIKVRIEPLEES